MDDLHGLGARLAPTPDGARPTVERVLVADGARLVLFAFSAGQRLSEHRAAFPILVQAVSGRLTFSAQGRDVVLVPGSVVHLPARVWHEVTAEQDSVMLLTMLDPGARSGAGD